MGKADRQARKAERRARRDARKARKTAKVQARRDTRADRKASRRDARLARQAGRQDARTARIDSRKQVRMARVEAKSEGGFWNPDSVAARQGTIAQLGQAGGELLGSLIGGGDAEGEAYMETPGGDVYAEEYYGEGEVIEGPFEEPEEPMFKPWMIAAAAGAGLVGWLALRGK